MNSIAPDIAYLDAIMEWAEQQQAAIDEAAQSQQENPEWHNEPTTEEKWAMWDYYEQQNNQYDER